MHTPVQFTDKKARQADKPKDLPKKVLIQNGIMIVCK